MLPNALARRVRVGMLLLTGLLLSQRAVAALACTSPATAMVRVELLFGAGLAAGDHVSDELWAQFVDEEITPRFPDGLTVLPAYGQWRLPDGPVIRELSRMLLIWYAPSAQKNADIEAIRAAYKTRFKQRSVMRVDGADCVSF